MTKDETARFFDRWHQAWAAQDVIALSNLYAPDCKVTSPMFGQMQGRAAVTESFKRLFKIFPDLNMRTEQLIIDNDRCAVVFVTNATHSAEFMGLPATGRKAKVSGVLVLKLDDNLVEEELRLYDFTALLVQVGVLRAKPGH
ncbi:MAG TPA: ester cyclase [Vicinamibacterales bacterium]|nr:ester cyclase [Vicinamibacterales bacterium]